MPSTVPGTKLSSIKMLALTYTQTIITKKYACMMYVYVYRERKRKKGREEGRKRERISEGKVLQKLLKMIIMYVRFLLEGT